MRTELGDGAGEEAIKDTINHLVANLTSEQWARDRWAEKYQKLNLGIIVFFLFRFEQIKDDSTVDDAKHYGAVFYTPEVTKEIAIEVSDEE